MGPEGEDLRNQVVTKDARGWSRRRIAKELGMSRNTVRRILAAVHNEREQGHSALPKLPVRRGSTLDDYEDFIKAQLEEFPLLTAVRMHEKLGEEGFEGGYTIVKERLRKLRPRPKRKPVTRFETAPGEQGQQDWSPYDIPFTEAGLQTVKAFSLVLGFSRRQRVRFCEDEKQITLMREHRKTFGHFGGVPSEILYDGQKAVVLRREAGRPIYNPRFLAFATHYDFRPVALPPRRPDLKGKIERPFDYVEKNLLGGRRFRDLAHLNETAAWWMEHRADVRKHGTVGERPIDRFVREAPALRPLPARPYDTAEVGYRLVSIEGEVDWEVTPYTVPVEHVLDVVVVRVTEDEVFIYDSDIKEIARHELAPRGQREPVVNSDHRPKKKRRHDIDALAARMSELDEVGALFAGGVLSRQRYRGSHLAQVLALQERYSADDLVAAIGRAVRYRAYDASVVQRILEASATPRLLPNTSQQAARSQLRSVLTPTTPRPMQEYAAAISGDYGAERDDEPDQEED